MGQHEIKDGDFKLGRNVNIEIMRAFVRFRRSLAGHADLAKHVDELEQKYDGQFGQV